MLLQISILCSVLWSSTLLCYTHHSLFAYSPVNGHLGCFLFYTVSGKVAVSIYVLIYLR